MLIITTTTIAITITSITSITSTAVSKEVLGNTSLHTAGAPRTDLVALVG
jgi:hypothetical protein